MLQCSNHKKLNQSDNEVKPALVSITLENTIKRAQFQKDLIVPIINSFEICVEFSVDLPKNVKTE